MTVEDCAFNSTWFAGLVLTKGARWNLIKGNYGTLTGEQGRLMIDGGGTATHDNLFLCNHLDPTVRPGDTRAQQGGYHRCISTYGYVGPRNHLIGNVMNSKNSYRCKYTVSDTVVQGNVMVGACQTFGALPYLWNGPEDRLVFRNNLFLSRVSASGAPLPSCGAGSNWADPYRAFVNNFVPSTKEGGISVETARFADPAYLDYRLQSDSPLRGKALGGGDVGAYYGPWGRVLYVSATGDDANPGTSARLPFASFSKAAATLRAGDTLYVMAGAYGDPLTVSASGREGAPITIRAWGKKDLSVPAIRVSGSWVELEGFTVSAPKDHGILITGRNVTLKRCVAHKCGGCGVRAIGASQLALTHCTLAGNRVGLTLDEGSIDATVRDSIFAANREGAVSVGEDSGVGYLASHNCYFGDGLDRARIEREIGSVIAAPRFVQADKGDYRLKWDSPAAHLAPFGRAAGAGADTGHRECQREPHLRRRGGHHLAHAERCHDWTRPLPAQGHREVAHFPTHRVGHGARCGADRPEAEHGVRGRCASHQRPRRRGGVHAELHDLGQAERTGDLLRGSRRRRPGRGAHTRDRLADHPEGLHRSRAGGHRALSARRVPWPVPTGPLRSPGAADHLPRGRWGSAHRRCWRARALREDLGPRLRHVGRLHLRERTARRIRPVVLHRPFPRHRDPELPRGTGSTGSRVGHLLLHPWLT